MKLFKITIKTYHFGIAQYVKYVCADSKQSAIECIIKYPCYRSDMDAEIESIEEIDLTDTTNRIL